MSRGLVPSADGEGRLGRAGKQWGSVHAAELYVDGVLFEPNGTPTPLVDDSAATAFIDLSQGFVKAAPTADVSYGFTAQAEAICTKVLLQGDSGEYTVAFPVATKWTGLYPNQLVNGKNFLFEFNALGNAAGDLYGTFHGTFLTETLGIIPNGTDLTVTASIDSTIVSKRAQIHSIDFIVDLASEINLEFDVKKNGVSLFSVTPKIATGHLTSAETDLGVLHRARRIVEIGDLLEVDIIAVGTPTIGEGLKVNITYLVL